MNKQINKTHCKACECFTWESKAGPDSLVTRVELMEVVSEDSGLRDSVVRSSPCKGSSITWCGNHLWLLLTHLKNCLSSF